MFCLQFSGQFQTQFVIAILIFKNGGCHITSFFKFEANSAEDAKIENIFKLRSRTKFGLGSKFVVPFAFFTLSTIDQLLQGFGFGGHKLVSFTDSIGLATKSRTAEVTYRFN
jgi:hypothetical protein